MKQKGCISICGDEVVILWHPKEGSENNSCITSSLKPEIIQKLKPVYNKKYGFTLN